MSGSGISWLAICKSAPRSWQITTPPLSFLQAGCTSCRPTKSVKALKAHITGFHFVSICIHGLLFYGKDKHSWISFPQSTTWRPLLRWKNSLAFPPTLQGKPTHVTLPISNTVLSVKVSIGAEMFVVNVQILETCNARWTQQSATKWGSPKLLINIKPFFSHIFLEFGRFPRHFSDTCQIRWHFPIKQNQNVSK